MGKRNEYGIQAICKHCNHIWFYSGFQPITSCPRCGWRVRIGYVDGYEETESNFGNFFIMMDNIHLTPIEKAKIELRKKIKRKETRKKNKIECLSYYSNGDPKCSYPDCNVTDIDLLTIDHINGDGWKDRKHKDIYFYLIKQHFPNGFKVLCFNHNWLEAKQKGFFSRGKQYDKPPIHPT